MRAVDGAFADVDGICWVVVGRGGAFQVPRSFSSSSIAHAVADRALSYAVLRFRATIRGLLAAFALWDLAERARAQKVDVTSGDFGIKLGNMTLKYPSASIHESCKMGM